MARHEDAIKTLWALTDRTAVSDWGSDLGCKGLSKGRYGALRFLPAWRRNKRAEIPEIREGFTPGIREMRDAKRGRKPFEGI